MSIINHRLGRTIGMTVASLALAAGGLAASQSIAHASLPSSFVSTCGTVWMFSGIYDTGCYEAQHYQDIGSSRVYGPWVYRYGTSAVDKCYAGITNYGVIYVK